MPRPDSAAFDEEVARALEALDISPAEPAADPLGDPAGAARALERLAGARAGETLLLRAAPELGAPGRSDETTYGPAPLDPVWLRVERGSSALRIAPLRLAPGGAGVEPREAASITVEAREHPCCDAPGCDRRRTHAAAWLALAGPDPARRLLVAEDHDLDAGRARARVLAVAAPLARALGVPLEEPGGGEGPPAASGAPDDDAPEEPAAALGAAALARFVLRSEGEPLVLRDHAGAGPRASAGRTLAAGLALLAIAAALWIQTARASGGDLGVLLGFGGAALLVSLAAYAFLGVARFSARYVARSTPLVWLARDRFVVAPWVSRTGAIDQRPEGRLGAAIVIGELRGVHVRDRGAGLWVVEMDTDHGPIDALRATSAPVARYFCAALARAAAAVRHPGGPSAKQRLRARAQGQGGGA